MTFIISSTTRTNIVSSAMLDCSITSLCHGCDVFLWSKNTWSAPAGAGVALRSAPQLWRKSLERSLMQRASDHTSYYHCWAGCCECATAVQLFKVTELLCLVGNKSDSSGKYYSSPVPPSCTAVNNMPCTFIGLYSSIYHRWMIYHFQIG